MRTISMIALRKFNRIQQCQEFKANRAEAKLFAALGYAKITTGIESQEIIADVPEITREYSPDTIVRRRGRPARQVEAE